MKKKAKTNPVVDDEVRERVVLTFDQKTIQKFDEVAERLGYNRSQAIRYLLTKGLESSLMIGATIESRDIIKIMMDATLEAHEQMNENAG